jgi:site-specific recombinase XerD
LRQNIDVHGIKKRYERAIRTLRADKRISDQNRKDILRFIDDLAAENIGLSRQLKYAYLLPTLAKFLKKDFRKATVNDIKRLVREVNESKYADWTKSDCRVTLKRFYRWLKHKPRGENPPETSWIRRELPRPRLCSLRLRDRGKNWGAA